ncbi:MAG: HAD-IIIA family hydrolase [Gemmatimonadota bacterium]|nr:HAD-IIIA family hydrolase [Gemmatimonadota bacterium]
MKIAHISDFHLRHHLPGTSTIPRRLSRHMPDLISQAVDRIRRESPDLVVVTGDLVDHPFYGMHDAELIALSEKDLRLVRECFAPLTCPVAFLYGNHDHPEAFHRVYGDLPADFHVAGHRVLLFFDDEVDANFPQRMGAQRERFIAAMNDDDASPQIHLQHYLVTPQRTGGYPHAYREAGSIKKALLADSRVRLVLSGHYHKGDSLFREGHVHIANAPAFGEPPHPFRIYDLSGTGIDQHEFEMRSSAVQRRRAVFLDRDGTLSPAPAYRTGPDAFSLLPGAAEALAKLKRAGYALVVVSNQTAVGQGYVTTETVGAVNDRMAALLELSGVELDGVYCRYGSQNAVVPEHRTDRPETKPSPAMLYAAAEDLDLELSGSLMVGDRKTDIDAGRNAGCRASILVKTGSGPEALAKMRPGHADFVAGDLADATAWILENG